MVAIPFSGAVGIPLSGVLLKISFLEPHGWRWIFILEGIAPVIAGFVTLFFLPDRPQDARWLPDEERKTLLAELDREHQGKKSHGHWAWVHHVGTVALLTLVYFGLNVSSYGLSMFMPAIIKSQTGATDFGASLISGVYYSIAAAAMLFNGWHSDHTHERIWHVCIPLAVQGIAIYAVATFDNVPVLPFVIVMVVVSVSHYAHLPAFWPIPTIFLGAIAAASAIGFINMVGNLGGYFGPSWVGKAATEDINWLNQLVESDRRGNSFLPAAEADPLKRALAQANTIEEVRDVRKLANLPADKRLSDKQLARIQTLESNLDEGNKLKPDQALAVARLLTAVSLRIELPKNETEQMNSLLGQGASFASGLKRLAPFPFMSAMIILIVGYFRLRKPVARPA